MVAGETTERSRRFDELEEKDGGFGLGVCFVCWVYMMSKKRFWYRMA